MLSYIGLRYVVEEKVVSIKRFGGIYAEFTDLGLIRPRGGGPEGQPLKERRESFADNVRKPNKKAIERKRYS